jgi:PadR family transcriptional regulator PadR
MLRGKKPVDSPDSGDLLQGTLELLILRALAQRGPMHGYGVAEWIARVSADALKGALYPALHRLELRGVLASEWGASEKNRRAKFYTLTPQGHKRLASEAERFDRLSSAVRLVMQAT